MWRGRRYTQEKKSEEASIKKKKKGEETEKENVNNREAVVYDLSLMI